MSPPISSQKPDFKIAKETQCSHSATVTFWLLAALYFDRFCLRPGLTLQRAPLNFHCKLRFLLRSEQKSDLLCWTFNRHKHRDELRPACWWTSAGRTPLSCGVPQYYSNGCAALTFGSSDVRSLSTITERIVKVKPSLTCLGSLTSTTPQRWWIHLSQPQSGHGDSHQWLLEVNEKQDAAGRNTHSHTESPVKLL